MASSIKEMLLFLSFRYFHETNKYSSNWLLFFDFFVSIILLIRKCTFLFLRCFLSKASRCVGMTLDLSSEQWPWIKWIFKRKRKRQDCFFQVIEIFFKPKKQQFARFCAILISNLFNMTEEISRHARIKSSFTFFSSQQIFSFLFIFFTLV